MTDTSGTEEETTASTETTPPAGDQSSPSPVDGPTPEVVSAPQAPASHTETIGIPNPAPPLTADGVTLEGVAPVEEGAIVNPEGATLMGADQVETFGASSLTASPAAFYTIFGSWANSSAGVPVQQVQQYQTGQGVWGKGGF